MNDIKQLIQELHKPVRPVEKFRKVRVNGVDDTWAMDLMIMPDDDGYKYCLTVEDVFSRYIWIKPMKTKDAKASWSAMEDILKQAGTKPKKLWCDQGSEFYNDVWKKKLKALNIVLYSTYSEWGVSIVESAIRTLKNWAQPMYESKGKLAWVEILPQVVKRYNTEHIHSALKMTPLQARQYAQKNTEELYMKQYGAYTPMLVKPKFKVGNWVRVAREKNIFEKGYDARWSYQPFQIRKVSVGDPVLYYLKEENGEAVEGGFYENELQKTEVPMTALVQKVLAKKGKKVLVRWRGIPERYDTWLDESQVSDLQ